jgi:predicted nucleic acid-binding protein
MRWITSALAEIELPTAIRTVAPEGLSAVPSVLARLDRFDIDPVIRSTAAAYPHLALRSLDAVHLATAQVAASTAPLTALAPTTVASVTRRSPWGFLPSRPARPS